MFQYFQLHLEQFLSRFTMGHVCFPPQHIFTFWCWSLNFNLGVPNQFTLPRKGLPLDNLQSVRQIQVYLSLPQQPSSNYPHFKYSICTELKPQTSFLLPLLPKYKLVCLIVPRKGPESCLIDVGGAQQKLVGWNKWACGRDPVFLAPN